MYVTITKGTVSFTTRLKLENGKESYKLIGKWPNMTSKEAKARNELLLKENAEPKNIDPDMPLFGDYKEEFYTTKLPNPNYRKSNKNAKRYANLKCNLNHIKELDNYPLNQITTN